MNAEGFLTLSNTVELKPYAARVFKQYEIMTYDEIIAGAGGYLIVDTENYENYFLIAFKDIKTKKRIIFEVDESGSNLDSRFLSWILHSYTTIGFNSIKYDMPLIWLSYYNQDLPTLKRASNDLISGMFPAEFKSQYKIQIFPTKHVDLIEVCPLRGSLKLYAARLHAQRIQDVPFNPYGSLTDEEINIVRDYCMNDLDATELLLDFMKDRLALREDISKRYKENVMSKSDAQIAETIICKEIMNRTGKYPKKSDVKAGFIFKYNPPPYIRYATSDLQKLLMDIETSDFVVNSFGAVDKPYSLVDRIISVGSLQFKFGIGGLHSCEECISFEANENYIISDRDVTSFYPNIILTRNLYPEHIGPVFLDIYKGFKDERVTAKLNKQFTYDRGLKIFINGASGKLNQLYSRLYSPKSYIQMTLTGQLSILMLVEILACNGFQVISGNTDGLVIYYRKDDYKKLIYWIEFWENETKFKTEETQYIKYYGRDVNAYFAVKMDGSVKVKGSYSEVGSQSGTQLDVNCATLICSDAIKLLLSRDVSIEKTIKECRDITRFVEIRNVKGGAHKNGNYLGKVVRWYYAVNETGTINNILTGNKVANTDGAMPCMDMPNEFPTNINYQWYIEHTIDILHEIGYLKHQQQIKLF